MIDAIQQGYRQRLLDRVWIRVSVSKRSRPTEHPEIQLDATLPEPLYKQLYGRLRGAILAGRLSRGAQLPSTRTLASELGVSRTTELA